MLSNAELICFAATQNPEAAKHFYANVLELKLIEDSPFALVFDANGTMLRIQKVQEHVPAKHTTLGWHVADIRSEMDELIRRGVRFERYERLPQDELGIWKSPSGALVAWFLDPDGNGLSLTEFSGNQFNAAKTRLRVSGTFDFEKAMTKRKHIADSDAHSGEIAGEALLEVVENQLQQDNPHEVSLTLHRLMNEGHLRDAAIRLIAAALVVEIFGVLKSSEAFNGPRYIENLRRLPELPA